MGNVKTHWDTISASQVKATMRRLGYDMATVRDTMGMCEAGPVGCLAVMHPMGHLAYITCQGCGEWDLKVEPASVRTQVERYLDRTFPRLDGIRRYLAAEYLEYVSTGTCPNGMHNERMHYESECMSCRQSVAYAETVYMADELLEDNGASVYPAIVKSGTYAIGEPAKVKTADGFILTCMVRAITPVPASGHVELSVCHVPA